MLYLFPPGLCAGGRGCRAVTALASGRLTLKALSYGQLEQCLSAAGRLRRSLQVQFSPELLAAPVPQVVRVKLAKMRGAPEADHLWYTYWLMIVNDSRAGVGLIGFKGYPDGRGRVEIGYGIDSGHRRQGYTTEAVKALTRWALAQSECSLVMAWTDRSNVASQGVLRKAGFRLVALEDEKTMWEIASTPVSRERAYPGRREG